MNPKNQQNNSFHLIQKLQNISFYSIHIYYNDIVVYPNIPNTDTDPFFRDPSLYQTISKESGPIYDKNNRDIFYASGQKGSYVCIIGPFCLQSLSQDKMIEYARTHHIAKIFDFRITRGSITQALDTLALVFSLLEKNIQSESSDNAPDNLENASENPSTFWFTNPNADSLGIHETEEDQYYVQAYQLYNAEKEIPHTPYEIETEIISAFQSSDQDKFYSLLHKMEDYSGGDFAYSSTKYKEYSAVSIITILTRAAITGGVSPNDAYALSDILLYKTSLCKKEQEYPEIFKEALDSFFKLMKKNNEVQNQSLYIRDCKVYISHHLNKELNPEILASQLGISKNYLMRLFTEHENITLMQYILRERVYAAANMLKYSDFDIMRVASYFHFQSQSHFGVVFKKYIGMSPAAYRKKNKPVGF